MEMKPRCPQMRLRALRHDVEMREWFPGKELGEAALTAWGTCGSIEACHKAKAESYFCLFFIKVKILYLSINKGTNVGLS